MKKITTLICLLNAIYSYSQDFENCIDSLYSQNFLTKLFAVECINDLKDYEAINALGELLESQPPYLQIQFLNALYTLEDPKILTRAHELISRADTFDEDPEHPYDPLEAKVFATTILVFSGDFSTIDYAFEKLNQDEITVDDALAFHLLPDIMENVPSYREEAKNVLLNEINNDDVDIKYYALLYLAEEFGEEMNDELVEKFVNSDDLPTKMMALKHLCINNYSDLNLLLKQQLELEEEWSLRTDIADSLIFRFGEPSDLKAVKDYQPNEPNETARSLMAYSIEEFIPPRPDTLKWSGLITKLISYTSEMYSYQWMANTQTRDYYISKLNLITSQIALGRYKDVCNTLNMDLLARIEKDLTSQNITTEGDKFLHYYTIYIKEAIEEELDACQ